MSVRSSLAVDLRGHVALVTGANHGIGAATARHLARCRASVFLTYLRTEDVPDRGLPDAYQHARSTPAETVTNEIRGAGGSADALEADLADPAVPQLLFDSAEAAFGPVDILVNNASGWIPDTFKSVSLDRLGRSIRPVSAETIDRVFAVDARASALLIAEFARRHLARGGAWGRIVGLTSGDPPGSPKRRPMEPPRRPSRTSR